MGVTLPVMATPDKSQNETAEAIKQLVEAMAQRNPGPLDQMGMSPERQAALQGRTPQRRCRTVAGVGENGSTFDIYVHAEPSMPQGKCVRFDNYRLPDGVMKHQSAGGRVPDGLQILKDPSQSALLTLMPEGKELPASAFTRQYHEWKREAFWFNDNRKIIGKELRAHFCAEGPGLKTPWTDAPAVAA